MKISISNLLNRRKKLNIILLVAVLCLSAFMFAIATTKNPRNSKAAGYISATKTLTIDDTCLGYLFLVRGVLDQHLTSSRNPFPDQTLDPYENDCGTGSSGMIFFPLDTSIVITGKTVITRTFMNTPIQLANLTVGSGGVITHEVLTIAESGTAPTFTVIGQGVYKMVNFDLSGNLTLEGGGKIDVSGKGYPNGYGPGHGLVGRCPDGKDCAGGGGYGGKGGQGNTAQLIGGPTYGSDAEPIDFGSGAGLSACGNDFFGGGRIKINADSITISDLSSMISANGNDDDHNCDFSPGGPSGGSIWLTANTIDTPAVHSYTPPNSDFAMADKGYTNTTRGTDGFVGTLMINGVLRYSGSSYNPAVPSYTNIFAKGGDIWRNGGAGGGGRIVIGSASQGSTSVYKYLEPVERLGANPVTNFNPYSLQVGDTIKVHIFHVSGLAPNSSNTISDEILKFPNNLACDPSPDPDTSYPGYTPTIASDKVTWTSVPADSSGKIIDDILYYECKIQQ